jgi:hypothetical protein
MFGKNIDMNKVEVKAGVKHFLSQAFKYFYNVILSYMKLGDVLEVLPMFMLKLSRNNLFSFGDMNNAPKCLAKFPLGLIII